MAMSTQPFSTEERAEQLKKCCETLIDNAEEIMKGIDYQVERKITISFPCNQTPTITIEQEIVSKKMLDYMIGK